MAQSKTQFGYRRHPDQDRAGAELAEYLVVVVGAGPVGLSLAIDLAQRGQRVVLLDDADRIGEGSRAICFSKRSLEYWDRLGVGSRMVDKGVVWSVGKIFHGASQLYQFNLLPEQGHKRPAFINLQQFYAEAYLVDRVRELPAIDLRWRNKVIGLEPRNDRVVVTIETPEGSYRLRANYIVACDGARSSLRQMVGAEFAGKVFEDQFLIADVKMTAEFPTERWFWFDPPGGRRYCTSSRMTSGGSICSSLRMPIPWPKDDRKTCGHASRECLDTTSSTSNGSRFTNSSAAGWTSSSMAA
jgi:3-(3-hydroxy-phenyl)propionate hydroxylase